MADNTQTGSTQQSWMDRIGSFNFKRKDTKYIKDPNNSGIKDLRGNAFTVGDVKGTMGPLLTSKGGGSSTSTSTNKGNGQSTGAIVTQNEQSKFHDPTKELKQAYLDKAANKILDRFMAAKNINSGFATDASEFIANRNAVAQNYNQFAQDKNSVNYSGAQYNYNDSTSTSKSNNYTQNFAEDNSPVRGLNDKARQRFNDKTGQGLYNGAEFTNRASQLISEELPSDPQARAMVDKIRGYIKGGDLSLQTDPTTGSVTVGVNWKKPNAAQAVHELDNYLTNTGALPK